MAAENAKRLLFWQKSDGEATEISFEEGKFHRHVDSPESGLPFTSNDIITKEMVMVEYATALGYLDNDEYDVDIPESLDLDMLSEMETVYNEQETSEDNKMPTPAEKKPKKKSSKKQSTPKTNQKAEPKVEPVAETPVEVPTEEAAKPIAYDSRVRRFFSQYADIYETGNLMSLDDVPLSLFRVAVVEYNKEVGKEALFFTDSEGNHLSDEDLNALSDMEDLQAQEAIKATAHLSCDKEYVDNFDNGLFSSIVCQYVADCQVYNDKESRDMLNDMSASRRYAYMTNYVSARETEFAKKDDPLIDDYPYVSVIEAFPVYGTLGTIKALKEGSPQACINEIQQVFTDQKEYADAEKKFEKTYIDSQMKSADNEVGNSSKKTDVAHQEGYKAYFDLEKNGPIRASRPSRSLSKQASISFGKPEGIQEQEPVKDKTRRKKVKDAYEPDKTETDKPTSNFRSKLHSLFTKVADKTQTPREAFANAIKHRFAVIGASYAAGYDAFKTRREAHKVADYKAFLEGKGLSVSEIQQTLEANATSSAEAMNGKANMDIDVAKPKYADGLHTGIHAVGFKQKVKRAAGDIGWGFKTVYASRMVDRYQDKIDAYEQKKALISKYLKSAPEPVTEPVITTKNETVIETVQNATANAAQNGPVYSVEYMRNCLSYLCENELSTEAMFNLGREIKNAGSRMERRAKNIMNKDTEMIAESVAGKEVPTEGKILQFNTAKKTVDRAATADAELNVDDIVGNQAEADDLSNGR